MTIVELREKRAKLWATMEGFLDTHRDRKGILSAEDDAVYANMEKELNDLTNEVRRMERRDAIAAELAKPVSSPITEQPQKATGEAKTGRASGAYREDFGLHLRGKRMLHNVLSEGVDANKAVELGFADEIMQRNSESEEVPTPAVSMLYSKVNVVNSLMEKIAAKCAIEPKPAVPERTGRSVDELRAKLNTIKNYI